MEQQAIFKTATFGGFDKKSVLDFIDELTENHHQAEESLRRKINEFSKAQDSQIAHIQQLKTELAQKEEESQALREQLAQKDQEVRSLRTQLSQKEANTPAEADVSPSTSSAQTDLYTPQTNALATENTRLQEELAALQCKYQETQQALESAKREKRRLETTLAEFEPKEKNMDAMLRKIGDAMVTARCNADQMLDEAKTNAQSLMTEAQDKARDILEESKSRAKKIVQEAKERDELSLRQTRQMTDSMLSRANSQIEQCFGVIPLMRKDCQSLQLQMENTLYSLQQRAKDLLETLSQLENHKSTAFSVPGAFHETPSPAEQPDVHVPVLTSDDALDDAAQFLSSALVSSTSAAKGFSSPTTAEEVSTTTAGSTTTVPTDATSPTVGRASPIKPLPNLDAVLARFSKGSVKIAPSPVTPPSRPDMYVQDEEDGVNVSPQTFGLSESEAKFFGLSKKT